MKSMAEERAEWVTAIPIPVGCESLPPGSLKPEGGDVAIIPGWLTGHPDAVGSLLGDFATYRPDLLRFVPQAVIEKYGPIIPTCPCCGEPGICEEDD